ncbi:MAG: T9SS type A sorting domain-containing protein, partial [Saprospiraceae bacterium]|nr:T9SS type A sorting domain-containing protein [Saprospiraceae bacterium]
LCLNDTATVRFPFARVCATSGTHKECSYPANNGSYAIALTEPGSYVLSAESYLPDITPNCPDKLIEITDITRDSAGLDFYFCGQPAADLSIAGYCEPARPGFQHLTVFRVTNQGFWKADTSTVSLKLSPYQTAPLFTPSPLQYDPATQLAVWKVPKLELYEQFNIEIRSVIQATLGDTLSIVGQVLPSTPVDNNLNNNQFLCETLVTGSYDPNDKTVSPLGMGEEGVISRNDTMLVYTIRFQNTGTDTAFTVVLRDTLDASVFNLNSVIPLMSSHPCRIDLERGNILVYTFDPILLPDSSRSEQGSKGYAVFSIRLKNNLASRVKIQNKAAIYFDYNAPIITNITQNTVLSTPNVSEPAFSVQLMPNPTADYSTLKLACNKPLDWVNISLSSVDGREQRPIYHAEHPAEWLSLPVDLSGLESGIYLVWIRSDKGIVVEKVVKM